VDAEEIINLREHKERARVHFIPDLKVGVFMTLRAPDVIKYHILFIYINLIFIQQLYIRHRSLCWRIKIAMAILCIKVNITVSAKQLCSELIKRAA
jgi:hypothetical protein